MHSKPFTEPIRKPRSKKKFQLQKHRRIARTLHSRWVQFDGRLFLVSSAFEVNKLNSFLRGMNDWNLCDKETFLRVFGCDGELTMQLLNRISVSLGYWLRGLESNNKSAAIHGREKQQREVEYLRFRLKFAFEALKKPRRGETNFLLDPSQERQFNCKVQFWENVCTPARMNARHRQLCRFVYWAGGLRPLERFVTAMLNTVDPETQLVGQVDSFIKWCDILLKRWPDEQRWVVAFEFKANQALRDFLQLAKQKGIESKIPRAGFPQRIENHRAALLEIREQLIETRDIGFPVAIAAWSCCAQTGDRLPFRAVQKLRNQTAALRVMDAANAHVTASFHSGYVRAIKLMDRREPLTPIRVLYKVCGWISRGNAFEDIEFCLDNLDPLSVRYDVCLAKLRRSAERSMQLLAEDKPSLFNLIHGDVRSDFQVELIDTVFRWLEKFPALSLNSQTKKTVFATLSNMCKLLKLISAQAALDDKVSDWFSKVNAVAVCFPDESSYPKQLRIWLRRLGYYQRLTNSKVALPKSLRRSLMAEEKRRKEITFLKAKVQAGTATSKARERFVYLSNVQVDERKNERKNLRDAQEACLMVGLESLRKIMVREAASVWTKATCQPIHESWSDSRVAEIGNWVRAMSSQQVGLLKKMLQAFVTDGAEYKAKLPFNEQWIAKIRSKGFAIDHWLFPIRKLTKIKDRQVVISVETDPYEIFMMGNYFGTCLSQGGCNQMAVLANAADANKQVVYVRDLNGTVLSRQLISISRQGHLLHYCLYIANKEVAGEDCFEDFRVEVDAYCRELAARVGLKLGDSGAPASLGNQSWYDDGSEEWAGKPKPPFWPPKPVENAASILQPGFTLQAGFNWPAVSCTQANYEYVQPRFQIELQ